MTLARISMLFALVVLICLGVGVMFAWALSPPPQDSPPPPGPPAPVVVQLYVRDRDHLDKVAGELDIWETYPHAEEEHVVAAVTPAQYRWLESLGYRMEIDTGKSALLGPTASLDPRFHYFDDFYPNANNRYVVSFLQDIDAAYPDLTQLIDIGNAWMAGQAGEHQRDVWVLRVTNEDPIYGPVEDKPAFFLSAAMHAREVAVPELAIRYVRYLTEGYGGEGGYGRDPDVTWLVDHNVAYVLVMQNPDGHWKNEQSTSNYRRKNMDWDDGCYDPALWGVDLNRNHSFLWGCCGGSSGSPCAETYRGPGRGSEPETQAFESYFAGITRDQNGPNGDDEIPAAAPITTTGMFISVHSYSDLVIWPWGFDDYGDSPNYAQLRTIGRKFAYYNGYNPSQSIWYDVDGAVDDWTYGKFGIASFTFEVGPSSGSCGGFFPAYGCIDGLDGMPRDFWGENKPAFLYAHKIARTPYMTAYGPDAQELTVTPDEIPLGTDAYLAATIADHRYGGDVLQPIAAAEYFLGAPGEDGAGIPMVPTDGDWGDLSEEVTATVDTSGLLLGQHYILVHGQNADGDWGPFSAVFLESTTVGDSAIIGVVRDGVTGRPVDQAEVGLLGGAAGQFATTGLDGAFAFTVFSGTYTLAVSAQCYHPATVTGVVALTGQTTTQPISLTVFQDAVLAGIDFTWEPPIPYPDAPVAFTAVVTGGVPTLPVTYTWGLGDDGPLVLGNPILHTYAVSETYRAVVTATNGCGVVTAAHTVVVLDQPDIVVDPLSLSAIVKPDGTATRTLAIGNVGTVDLSWDLVESPDVGWLEAVPVSGTLAVALGMRGSVGVDVAFDAAGLADGIYTTTIQVHSDDPDEPRLDVSVVMTMAPHRVYLPVVVRRVVRP